MPVATSHRASILVLQRTARPPRTTLSPYTTLFRSAGRGGGGTPRDPFRPRRHLAMHVRGRVHKGLPQARRSRGGDRKSTRLNSSHTVISYAVFCLKKKNTTTIPPQSPTAVANVYHK